MKDIPPEVLDEIISCLPPYDMQSFRNSSLVAKSWIYPSRRRLFEVIDKLQDATLRLWLNDASPKNVELLQHVRSLSIKVNSSHHRPGTLLDFPHRDPPLFPRLRRLVVQSASPKSIAQLGVSLASQHTLEYLCLCCCQVTISTLATIINHFPNLIHLELLSLFNDVDDKPTPPLSRPLRKLTVDEPDSFDEFGILDQLLELRPQCDEVTISVSPLSAPSLTQRIIDGVDATVKRLDLNISTNCEYIAKNLSSVLLNETLAGLGEPLSLANCQELCELKVYSWELMETDLISTITSTEIQKITLNPLGPLVETVFTSLGRDYWTQLDSSLRQLIDRAEYKLRLEVEFRFSSSEKWAGKPLFEEHLPMVHEKARVSAVDIGDGAVVYCSDRARESQRKE